MLPTRPSMRPFHYDLITITGCYQNMIFPSVKYFVSYVMGWSYHFSAWLIPAWAFAWVWVKEYLSLQDWEPLQSVIAITVVLNSVSDLRSQYSVTTILRHERIKFQEIHSATNQIMGMALVQLIFSLSIWSSSPVMSSSLTEHHYRSSIQSVRSS